MAIEVQWRIVRRLNATTGEKETVEGQQRFASVSAARAFITQRLDAAQGAADLYKMNIMLALV